MPRQREFDEATVLERARDLFWRRGYTATSIQDLEEHLGLSRSSLYRTFGGKRQLYDRTLATYQEANLERLRRSLTSTKNLRASLNRLFTEAARQRHPDCASRARGCYIVNATTEMANNCAEALDFVAGNRERFVALMEGAVARAQVRGELEQQADPRELANYLFVCYNGLQVVVQTKIGRDELVRAVERAVAGLPWQKAGQ